MSQMSGLKTNLDYWKISLANPEPDLPEEFYTHDELRDCLRKRASRRIIDGRSVEHDEARQCEVEQ